MKPCGGRTVADFLLSQPLTVDVEFDDEAVGLVPLKGVEFEASVLCVGLPDYAGLCLELSPTEQLLYRLLFARWLQHGVESLMGGVVMQQHESGVLLLFTRRSGSADPFADALRAARWIGDNDELLFRPLMGLASGRVAAGFTGFSGAVAGSVFGRAVVMAAACSRLNLQGEMAASVTFPADEWRGRSMAELFPPVEVEQPEEPKVRRPSPWRIGEPRMVELGGFGSCELLDVATFVHSMSAVDARQQVREWFGRIRAAGYYRPGRE